MSCHHPTKCHFSPIGRSSVGNSRCRIRQHADKDRRTRSLHFEYVIRLSYFFNINWATRIRCVVLAISCFTWRVLRSFTFDCRLCGVSSSRTDKRPSPSLTNGVEIFQMKIFARIPLISFWITVKKNSSLIADNKFACWLENLARYKRLSAG